MSHAQSDAFQRDYDRSVALDSAGKYTQAIKLLDKLVAEPSWEFRARMRRSSAYLGSGAHELAFNDVSAAMRLEPDSIGPYMNRGSMYLSAGMPERALADFDDGLKKSIRTEDSVSFYLNRGSALGMMRRFQEALESYDKALRIEPTNSSVRLNKASHPG